VRSLQHTRRVTEARRALRVRRKATNLMLTPVLGFHRDRDFDHMRAASLSDAGLPGADEEPSAKQALEEPIPIEMRRRLAVSLPSPGPAPSSADPGGAGSVDWVAGESSEVALAATGDPTQWTANPLRRLEVDAAAGARPTRRGGRLAPPGPVPSALAAFSAVQHSALVITRVPGGGASAAGTSPSGQGTGVSGGGGGGGLLGRLPPEPESAGHRPTPVRGAGSQSLPRVGSGAQESVTSQASSEPEPDPEPPLPGAAPVV
jgi:hypothetical protein